MGKKYSASKAKMDFKKMSIDNPDLGKDIRGWLKQESNRGKSYWRNPPGLDIGHKFPGVHDPKTFNFENIDMNRSKPGISRRVDKRLGSNGGLFKKRR
jgi:hypothetical protein